jgi:hypothetical protein
MRKILLLTALFLGVLVKGQTNYNYNSLPDSIKKDAKYIIWEDLVQFEVIDEGKAIEKARFAVCITSPNAEAYNAIRINYRKDESVINFDATIYDASGSLVKRLKNNEIMDVSSVSQSSLFEDDRVKYANFTHNRYPYTLVFEYQKKIVGLYNYPSDFFKSNDDAFVFNVKYEVIVPQGFKFKYRELNIKNPLSKTLKDGKDIYEWNESNIPPERTVELLPHFKYYLKMIRLAPISFIEGGYKGDLESWNSMGFWNLALNEGRDQLPDATKQKINELIKDAKNDREKVKILYRYMQEKTRYVSVQSGIGGYQPFPADYVDSKGYGDCKALANYMQTLLKVAKIKSYYTIVHAGEFADDILTDFPSNQFNHVILCVPLQEDSLWLECTSQKQPFNFLGSFTNDRHAVMMTEEGGKLVKTPKYPKELNTQIRKVSIEIDGNGNAKASLMTVFNCLYSENRPGMNEKSLKDQNDFLKSEYPISGMEIKSMQFTDRKDEIPSVVEKLELNLPMFASISNKRMFVKLNQFSPGVDVPKNEERKIPFQIRFEGICIDTVNITVPEGYTLEAMPKAVELKTKFGSYSFSITPNANVFTCVRTYSINKNTYEASDYKAYYDYKKQISNADKAKLVFVKKI